MASETDTTEAFAVDAALDRQIARAAASVAGARHVVALTGAGLSVESGIPPFRGPGGLWTKSGEPPLDGFQRRASPGRRASPRRSAARDRTPDTSPSRPSSTAATSPP